MQDLWTRLEAWRAKNASDRPFRLRPPASATAIADAEKTMAVVFPADFRESLLVHDGEEDYEGDPERFDWMPGCDRLAPLEAIVAQWLDEQDRVQDAEADEREVTEDDRFRNVMWHSKRIPIAGSPYWDQDNTYLDLVPGPKGASGQLVTMTSECDFTVLHSGFRPALRRYVEALENGEWIASKDYTGPEDRKGDHGFHPADAFAALVRRDGAAAT